MKKYINKIIKAFSQNKDTKSAKEYIDLGISMYKKKDYKEAIKCFTKIISLDDTNYAAYLLRGDSYLGIKKFKYALKDFSRAISMEPDDKELYLKKGVAYSGLRKYNDAIPELDKAINLDPEYDKALMLRGICYVMLKKYAKSITDMEISVKLNPENANQLNPYIDECKKQLAANAKKMRDEMLNNPIMKQQQANYDMQKKMIDNMKSTDKDEIPWGEGEFGYSPSNPIPTLTSFGNIAYLARLQTMKGEKVKYARLGSTNVENIERPVDIYEISDSNGVICKLYISMYHQRNSEKAPRGFKRAGG